MRHFTTKLIGCVLGVGVVCLPAWSVDSSRRANAYPGTLNYVEGQVSIGNQTLSSNSIGSAQLQPGQSISTENGKAEVLLTPGVFLRLGNDTEVKMVSPSLTDTEVELQKGEATVEVTDIHPQNRLLVDEGGASAQMVKNGFYDFDATDGEVRVFDGQAMVQENDKDVKVKAGKELNLDSPKLKPEHFDKKTYESSDLYNWSSLRSAYIAEANADLAPTYIVGGGFGPGWFGLGWYWDPWFSCYTFLPGNGMFYSPFGWGFYSPIWAYRLGYTRGFNGHFPHTFSTDPHAWGPGLHNAPVLRGGRLTPAAPLRQNPRGFGVYRGGFPGSNPGGFRGSAGMGGGEVGGFHGAVGGFHGPGR
jgi:FecR protein